LKQILSARSEITDNSFAAKGPSPAAHRQSKLSEDVSNLTVAQGNDVDCYGELIGSILGAYFGPGHLKERWLAPLNDEIRTGLGCFYEQSLSEVAKRMGELPQRIAEQTA
jgi:hypothetical protein